MVSTVLTRSWRADDLKLLRQAANGFSERTLTRRFLTSTTRLPGGYLAGIERPDRRGLHWLGQVALVEGELVGLAECAWPVSDPDHADLAVLVADAWQGHGIGPRLVEELLCVCVTAGLRYIEAISDLDNYATRTLAQRLAGQPGRRCGWTIRNTTHFNLRQMVFTHRDTRLGEV
ncbi:GNAT family N-acetyltransferase [Actinoplanes solisilvae]|uniref:GNAT family N-acetyltransferase n=1 Tax=Actinoplanes solisilvae TaxID=2486853 RepID=UPI0013E3FA60|nr:GNAT family N-acetyltransferase [Actinoplanes solisilvae]